MPSNLITIRGNRQTGKTETAIDTMIRRAQDGLRVAYLGHTLRGVVEVQARVVQRGGHIKAAYDANRNILYPSGGSIRFVSPRGLRGHQFDVVVVDELEVPPDAFIAVVGSERPTVIHIPPVED